MLTFRLGLIAGLAFMTSISAAQTESAETAQPRNLVSLEVTGPFNLHFTAACERANKKGNIAFRLPLSISPSDLENTYWSSGAEFRYYAPVAPETKLYAELGFEIGQGNPPGVFGPFLFHAFTFETGAQFDLAPRFGMSAAIGARSFQFHSRFNSSQFFPYEPELNTKFGMYFRF